MHNALCILHMAIPQLSNFLKEKTERRENNPLFPVLSSPLKPRQLPGVVHQDIPSLMLQSEVPLPTHL